MAVHEEAFDFGLRLKALRDARGMSQEQLARQVGVSKGHLQIRGERTGSSVECGNKACTCFRDVLGYAGGTGKFHNGETARPAGEETGNIDGISP